MRLSLAHILLLVTCCDKQASLASSVPCDSVSGTRFKGVLRCRHYQAEGHKGRRHEITEAISDLGAAVPASNRAFAPGASPAQQTAAAHVPDDQQTAAHASYDQQAAAHVAKDHHRAAHAVDDQHAVAEAVVQAAAAQQQPLPSLSAQVDHQSGDEATAAVSSAEDSRHSPCAEAAITACVHTASDQPSCQPLPGNTAETHTKAVATEASKSAHPGAAVLNSLSQPGTIHDHQAELCSMTVPLVASTTLEGHNKTVPKVGAQTDHQQLLAFAQAAKSLH